jgi:hypothetical protein
MGGDAALFCGGRGWLDCSLWDLLWYGMGTGEHCWLQPLNNADVSDAQVSPPQCSLRLNRAMRNLQPSALVPSRRLMVWNLYKLDIALYPA